MKEVGGVGWGKKKSYLSVCSPEFNSDRTGSLVQKFVEQDCDSFNKLFVFISDIDFYELFANVF